MEYTFSFLAGFKTSTYIPVSSAALLVYDYLLTLSDEVRYVWGSPWSLVKILFVLSRYPTLFTAIIEIHRNVAHDVSNSECQTLTTLNGYMYLFIVLTAEGMHGFLAPLLRGPLPFRALTPFSTTAILVVRVWALWHRRKVITWVLGLMTIVGLAAGLVVLFRIEGGEFYVPKNAIHSLAYPGCIPVAGSDRTALVAYIIAVAYESGVFALMIINSVTSHFRMAASSFMYNFYKDGALYFAALLCVSVVNLVIILTQPVEYTNLLITTQAALHSMLSTRILLNLRRRSDVSSSASSRSPYSRCSDISNLRFAETSPRNSIGLGTDGQTWFGHGSQAVEERNEALISPRMRDLQQ